MNTKDTMNKTAGTWTTKADEILIKLGLTPKYLNKTGSCIMPAPKRLQSAKQQQNFQNQNKNKKE